MTTSFQNAVARNVGESEVVMYTVAVGQKAVLMGCNASNIFGSIVPFSLILRRTAGDTFITKDQRINNGENKEVLQGKVVLVAGDSLVAKAGIDASFDVIASLLAGVK
jgi:hypothetical protein